MTRRRNRAAAAEGRYALPGGQARRSLVRLARLMMTERNAARIVRACSRMWSRAAAAGTRDMAAVWCAEWHWLHNAPLEGAHMPWPSGHRLRTRLLTACLNGGMVPPEEAWEWLGGAGVCADSAAWARTWAEFAAVARVKAGSRTALCCLLAGTPAAETREARLVEWLSERVATVFRCAWRRCMRTGREQASRLEDAWWRRVRSAVPGEEPVRHARLPGSAMHLDVFWPRARLALEIQGEPHWRAVGRFGGDAGFAARQERDARKRAICLALGIRLVEATHHSDPATVCRLLAAARR